MKYIHLNAEGELPKIALDIPFKAIVIIELSVSQKWQNQVSRWLVDSGCRYMLAWGVGCSSWDDSVDWASLERDDFQEVPKSEFVITTWHEKDSLEEVFWFAKHCAKHEVHQLSDTVILHIASNENRAKIERLCEGV